MNGHKSLKVLLMLHSFLPLFLLLSISIYDDRTKSLIKSLFSSIINKELMTWINNIGSFNTFLTLSLIFILFMLIIVDIFTLVLFNKIQKYDFKEDPNGVHIISYTTENSVVFFVTYITPLLLDDIISKKGILKLAIIFISLILLMRNTTMYCQNPVLTILGYKTFIFQFNNKEENNIGITRKNLDSSKTVKYKLISDNVYLIYNKN